MGLDFADVCYILEESTVSKFVPHARSLETSCHRPYLRESQTHGMLLQSGL